MRSIIINLAKTISKILPRYRFNFPSVVIHLVIILTLTFSIIFTITALILFFFVLLQCNQQISMSEYGFHNYYSRGESVF